MSEHQLDGEINTQAKQAGLWTTDPKTNQVVFQPFSTPNAYLFSALARAEAMMSAPKEDGYNKHFQYNYVTLTSIMEVVRPALAASGLAIYQEVDNAGEKAVKVRLVLVHESGESHTTPFFTMPIIPNRPNDSISPQDYGKTIAYARKYQILAFFGLSSDQDADQTAPSNETSKKQVQAQNESVQSSQQAPKSQAPNPDAELKTKIGENWQALGIGEDTFKETRAHFVLLCTDKKEQFETSDYRKIQSSQTLVFNWSKRKELKGKMLGAFLVWREVNFADQKMGVGNLNTTYEQFIDTVANIKTEDEGLQTTEINLDNKDMPF
jgi:hypothetical protein